jgi:hypothetical protein
MGIKLGNGKWATKEDELLAYRVIEGKYFNRSFDFARSSTTTRVNKDGYIEDVPSDTARIDFADSVDGALLTEPASTNLITYPISFGNSYWSKSGASIEPDSSTDSGSNLLPDGDFNDPNDWEQQDGWNISGLVASCDGTQTATTSVKQQPDAWVVGKSYKATMNVTVTQGEWRVTFGGYTSSDFSTESGSVTVYFTSISQSNGWFHLTGDSSFIGSFSNVVVKEVQGFETPKEIPVANGEELVTNGDFEDGNTDWNENSDWTIAAGVATSSGMSNNRIFQTSLLSSDTTYCYSFDKTRVSGTSIIIQYYTGSGYVNIDEISSTGATTETGHFTTGTSNGTLYFKAQGSWVGSIDNISVKEATSYSGGGLEREAYKLVEGTNNGSHYTSEDVAGLSAGSTLTFSLFVKTEERTKIKHIDWSNAQAHVNIDVSNETISNSGSNIVDVRFEQNANGWKRISVTYILDGSQTGVTNRIYLANDSSQTNYQGDGTSGLYIAYAQLEEQASATSLMLPVTEGSTTSRVADDCNGSGTAQDFKDYNTSGVLYAEIAANSDDLTSRYISISDGTNDNRVNIYYRNVSDGIYYYIGVGGVKSAGSGYSATDITDFHKVAVRWAVNDFSLWVDGVEVATDTNGSVFSANTLTELAFDAGSGGSDFYGKTRAVEVLPYMSDAEMETLTT